MGLNFKNSGQFVITVTRIGATGASLPVQLFGAVDGILDVTQEGALASFVPKGSLNVLPTTQKIAEKLANGDVRIIDLTTGFGVLISAKKIPYVSFLEKLASRGDADEPAYIISNIKLGYSHEDTIAEDMRVHSRSIFGDLDNLPIEPNSYFDKDQQQSNIIDIDEIIELTPARKMDFLLAGNETKVTFNLTLNAVQSF